MSVILYGASGHGKVVKSALNNKVAHFFDDNDLINHFEGIRVSTYDKESFSDLPIIISIGNNNIRKKIVKGTFHKFSIAIADSATVYDIEKIGIGSQILHHGLVQVGTKIGCHVIVNSSASIDHDCTIADFAHIAPNATLCGNVSIGEGTLIGAGSVVIPGIKIGSWCSIGAGAVVTKDIPDNSVAVGNPAKIIRRNNGQ